MQSFNSFLVIIFLVLNINISATENSQPNYFEEYKKIYLDTHQIPDEYMFFDYYDHLGYECIFSSLTTPTVRKFTKAGRVVIDPGYEDWIPPKFYVVAGPSFKNHNVQLFLNYKTDTDFIVVDTRPIPNANWHFRINFELELFSFRMINGSDKKNESYGYCAAR